MDTNDLKKVLLDREQRIAEIIEQYRTSDQQVLQLIAAQMEPLFREVLELQEKLFSIKEPTKD